MKEILSLPNQHQRCRERQKDWPRNSAQNLADYEKKLLMNYISSCGEQVEMGRVQSLATLTLPIRAR
jgi:hypothetical protein